MKIWNYNKGQIVLDDVLLVCSCRNGIRERAVVVTAEKEFMIEGAHVITAFAEALADFKGLK